MKSKRVTSTLLRRWPLPALDGKLGKEGRGQVLVVGGSREVPGAVHLAAIAALRAGAGKLQIATANEVAASLATAVPEARVIALPTNRRGELARSSAKHLTAEIDGCDALLIGSGMYDAAAAEPMVARARRCTLVLDAAALDAAAHARAPAILTPHAGEMAKLMKLERRDVLAAPAEVALDAAKRLSAVVALKGAVTFIASPDGELYENRAGNLGLGTSGSGDTLAGVVTGLVARGAEPLQAAVWGVHVHACAGDVLAREVGPLGYLARELLRAIPGVIAKLSR